MAAVLVKVFRLRDPGITDNDIAGRLVLNVKNGGYYPGGEFSVYGTWVGSRESAEILVLRSDRPAFHRAANNFADKIEERWKSLSYRPLPLGN